LDPPRRSSWRSRARRRGDEDFEVNDTGSKSWYGPPSSGGKAGWRGSVAGYFAGASLANASSGQGRRGQSPGGGSTATAGAWNEMKDDPSAASGGKEFNDVYPLSGSAAPFASQSANPFMDPNQVSRPEGLDNPYPASYPRHHEGHERQQEQYQGRQSQQPDDQLDDIYGSYDDHEGYDPDADGPVLSHAADGWEEREGESDYDRQKRWEDEGRAGAGGRGHQQHTRDQSFGGGGEHGDGMVSRPSSFAGSSTLCANARPLPPASDSTLSPCDVSSAVSCSSLIRSSTIDVAVAGHPRHALCPRLALTERPLDRPSLGFRCVRFRGATTARHPSSPLPAGTPACLPTTALVPSLVRPPAGLCLSPLLRFAVARSLSTSRSEFMSPL
jgi:hypothetical protein